ncbi:MAG: ArsR/SmtB family transcription factor [Cellulosilyticaceae bacterium]
MSFNLHTNIHPIMESISLLQHIANNTSPLGLKDELRQKYGIPFDTLNPIFDSIIAIYDTLQKQLLSHQDTVQKYFKYFSLDNNSNLFLGNIFSDLFLKDTFTDDFKNFKNLDDTEKEKQIFECFSVLSNDFYTHLACPYDLFELLEKLAYPSHVKYEYIRLFYTFEASYEEISNLMLYTSRLIVPYQEDFTLLFDRYLCQLFDEIKIGGAQTIKKYFPLDLSTDDCYQVYPNFFASNSITVMQIGTDLNYIFIGFTALKTLTFTKNYNCTQSQLLSFLKIVSDKSKLEILKLLRHNKLYATELADKLEITGATISHHMSALANMGLITIEKTNNKVYYSLNLEKIRYYTKELTNLLDL